GNESFYQTENGNVYFYDQGAYKQQNFNKKEIIIKRIKDVNGVIKKNTGESLSDLGDGVAGLELHSQSNAIGLDIIQMMNYAIDEFEANYEGLVIGNQCTNFCVGRTINMMLREAQID